MNYSVPKSLIFSFLGILSIPAIAFASFQYIYPSDPVLAFTKHGELTLEWEKFSENDDFTEYLGKDKTFDEDTLTANILVMRNYQQPQSSLYEHEQVHYSSMVAHQTINCRNRTVSVRDLMLFSSKLSKGRLVKDLYELDYENGEAQPGSIDEKKVVSLCGFTS